MENRRTQSDWETVLTVDHLFVAFDNERVLSDVSFTLAQGETLAVVGPNGAGKTVLVRAILGLIPHQGTVTLAKGTKIGYVPQRLTVGRNMPLTVKEFLHLRTTDNEKILAVLKEVDPFHKDAAASYALTPHRPDVFLNQRVGVLSGGQFQKVLIAWALLGDPTLLLFDEPTAGLDIGGEETMYELLRRLQIQRKLAVLLISHDLTIVYRYAQQVLCLNRSAICFGPPQEALDPKTLQKLYGHNMGFYQHRHTIPQEPLS